MQPLLMNEALCSWLWHVSYHWLPAFNASMDEETKSQ